LTVANPNDKPIIFKVKTTAPKLYCVRPNSGRVEPGEKVQVQVLLQPMKEDPPTGTKCRDKFLVQSAFVPPDAAANSFTEIWQAVEKTSKSEIAEQKIRCAYLPPLDSSIPEDPAEHVSDIMINASTFTRAGTEYTNARDDREETRYSTLKSNFTLPPYSLSENETTDEPESIPARSIPPSSSKVPAPAEHVQRMEDLPEEVEHVSRQQSNHVSTSNGTSYSLEFVEGLKQKYEREIERLKNELNEGLRKRNLPDTSEVKEKVGEKIAVMQEKTGTEGVPVQVVAGLVVGVFVITWLFF